MFGLARFWCFVFLYRLNVPFYYYVFVCILSEKAVPEITYIMSGGTLNPTHSLTHYPLNDAPDSSIDSYLLSSPMKSLGVNSVNTYK